MAKVKQQKNCSNCDNCKKHQEHAFELEVDEDLRQERLNNFWKKYRWFVYAAIALILGTTAGIQIYQSWRMKTRLEESDIYENALVLLYTQEMEAAIPALEKLANEGQTGYRYMAKLQLAGVYARSNRQADAVKYFRDLMNSDAPKNIRQTATLSYVDSQLTAGNTQELLPLLEQLMNDPDYVRLAADLIAAIYLNDGKKDEAVRFLQSCEERSDIPEDTKAHLIQIKRVIENK